MATLTSFEDYQNRNRELAHLIGVAQDNEETGEQLKFKRELYSNKLLMIDILEDEEVANHIAAKCLIEDVESRAPAVRYKTGLRDLDENLKGGFEVGSLILVGGQSTAGKTHTLLDILSNVSKSHKCLFFNFEMGDRRIVSRLKKLLTTKEQLSNFMIDSTSRKLDDLVMEIRLAAKDGMKFFAIDSRMKIITGGKDPEHLKIAQVTKRLSEVAISNDIIVILINQVSEEDIKNKRLSFKGSGDQIYDADMALFITIENGGVRQLHCIKNRQDEFLFDFTLPRVIKFEHTTYKG